MCKAIIHFITLSSVLKILNSHIYVVFGKENKE